MKNISWKQIIPHIIALAVFLVVALVYSKPALQGEVLQQSDIVQWKGMAQNAFEYKEKHGHFPLWNTHLFSGMPNYQVAMEGKSLLPDFNKIMTLGLPKPVSFFFLACVCFYILCMAFGTNYLIAILGSLAYAYSTFDPIIIVTGHESQMMAIAYMPALLAGIILLYEKKYILGLFVTAFFATYEIAANHIQITYYTLLIIGIMTIAYIIRWIKAGAYKHMLIALSLALLGGVIGVANCAVSLLTTSEYAKYTMRGGKTLEINGNDLKEVKTTGLDLDYAFSYSLGKAEIATLMMPHAFGENSGTTLGDNSNVAKGLVSKGVPEENAQQLAQQLPRYWGGIVEGTSGVGYLGASICLLFLIGLVVVKSQHRWWILAAVLFGIFISWGKYFSGFNEFLFDYLPLYNKFRAPSMAVVIPQLLCCAMAVLCLQRVFFIDNRKELSDNFKKILYVLGGVFIVLLLLYIGNDYVSGGDDRLRSMLSQATGNNADITSTIYNSLLLDRKAMFGADILRTLFFAIAIVAALFLYMRNMVNPIALIIALAVINTVDLLQVDSHYLNGESYVEPDSYTANFTPSPAVQEILKDNSPHYRVFNIADNPFNESLTAYYLRCVGGYHPAKLRLYQDLIENQIAKNNMHVLNMLDTKYFIVPSQQQQGGQPGPAMVQRNDSAMGACWFVKNVQFVNGPVAEMKALDNFNPAQTAYVDASFKPAVQPVSAPDSTATISLVSYDNDDIKYTSQSSTNGFAVFSEIYYPAGWNAYIDGKQADYVKTDYALRGMSIPAGKHTIEFRFHPDSYYNGQTYSLIGNALLWLCFGGFIYYLWKRYKPASSTTENRSK